MVAKIKKEVFWKYVLGDIFSETNFRVMFVDEVNLGRRTRLFLAGSLDFLNTIGRTVSLWYSITPRF